MFIGFLEYIISQIVLKPGYIPGDYVGANELFSEEGPHSQWATYQVCMHVHNIGTTRLHNIVFRHVSPMNSVWTDGL